MGLMKERRHTTEGDRERDWGFNRDEMYIPHWGLKSSFSTKMVLLWTCAAVAHLRRLERKPNNNNNSEYISVCLLCGNECKIHSLTAVTRFVKTFKCLSKTTNNFWTSSDNNNKTRRNTTHTYTWQRTMWLAMPKLVSRMREQEEKNKI